MRNNESRTDCATFVKALGASRIGTTNMFAFKGRIWCYTNGNDDQSVRQFYDMADGVCVAGVFILRKNLLIGSVTRISNTYGVARNALY